MTICVIPARGGSKRIPRKNIKPFLGRPMIADDVARMALPDDTPVFCLSPDAPFDEVVDFRAGLGEPKGARTAFVLPVTTFAFQVERALCGDTKGGLAPMSPEYALTLMEADG